MTGPAPINQQVQSNTSYFGRPVERTVSEAETRAAVAEASAPYPGGTTPGPQSIMVSLMAIRARNDRLHQENNGADSSIINTIRRV